MPDTPITLHDTPQFRILQDSLKVCDHYLGYLREEVIPYTEPWPSLCLPAEFADLFEKKTKQFNLDSRQVAAEIAYNNFFLLHSNFSVERDTLPDYSLLTAGTDKFANAGLHNILEIFAKGDTEEDYVHFAANASLCPRINNIQTPVAAMTIYDRFILSAFDMAITTDAFENGLLKCKKGHLHRKRPACDVTKAFGQNMVLVANVLYSYALKLAQENNYKFPDIQKPNFPATEF